MKTAVAALLIAAGLALAPTAHAAPAAPAPVTSLQDIKTRIDKLGKDLREKQQRALLTKRFQDWLKAHPHTHPHPAP